MTQAGGKILPELHEKFAKYAEENSFYIIYMFDRVMTKVMEYSKAV
jgi:hypothetical protein